MATGVDWRRWGPYLAERQWGTVREDYSPDGDAWVAFPFEQAISRAYRWGEDGLAGWSDDKQKLCLSLALWNGLDPILKERLYGLTNAQGNHGEDVKELYYYLDGVPSHAYLKMLYKYPQARFPYERLRDENARRGLDEREFELIDTGVFDDDAYFDVEIEYAKAGVEDVLMRVRATNRGARPARLCLIPQLWLRNRWSWAPLDARPELRLEGGRIGVYQSDDVERELAWDFSGKPLFCDNDTNYHKLWGQPRSGYAKDGVNDYLVLGDESAINPAGRGTKAAVAQDLTLAPGATATIRLRLRLRDASDPFADFDATMARRIEETDAFYQALQADLADADARLVQRQAYAGMLWCKQFYGYDIRRWLKGDPLQPPPPAARNAGRNSDWLHFACGDTDVAQSGDIMSMPDSWEYPWFAAWDLAFHCVVLTAIDPAFAKSQLTLLTQSRLMHPSGQLPAYEWNFDDVNPPVQAWAALRIYDLDAAATGVADRMFLERVFHKLLLNFTWWVNREDEGGRNIFQGGFLGLDNIGLFDMRKPLPFGGRLDQSDGTAWVAAYALAMMRMALELAKANPTYEDLATKFFEHFLEIAQAMHGAGEPGDEGLWDEREAFYFDVLRAPGQDPTLLRIRSIVGLLPIVAAELVPGDLFDRFPQFSARTEWFIQHRPELARLVSDWRQPNANGDRLLGLMRRRRLNALLTRMLDETEFLSPHGVRSVSRHHLDHPFEVSFADQTFSLKYEPGEGETRLYGGNSNWRGPVWAPINFLLIEGLRKLHRFYGDEFRMECPTGSQTYMHLGEIADELSRRFCALFLKEGSGRRAYQAATPRFDDDPHFRDRLQFFEYFHGDTGRGCGASHQTGWSGVVALLLRDATRPSPDAGERSHQTT
ncbi:MAG: glucosidase [Pseudomonadota bacterium]|nr:glucosidase [Pseudomonadota bacterium]